MIVGHAVASATRPFIGLRPFDKDDQPFFFGRGDSIDAVESLVVQNGFVAVIGSSGSGKSSLIRAGLLPKLEKWTDGTWLLAQPMAPGDDPIGNLARAISSLRPKDELSEAWNENVEACLRRSTIGVPEALSLLPELAGDVLIVVDQFEELFRFADLRAERRSESATALQNRDEATGFVRLLLAADSVPSIPVHVVLTMRSDYFGDCSLFYGLPEAVTRRLFLVPGLTRDQRAAAITRPAEMAGGAVDPGLVQRLLNDTNEELDQLPIIQHTMMRCWQSAVERVERSGGGQVHVVVEDYKGIGEVKEALSNHADEIFQEFSRFDKEGNVAVSRQLIAKRVFQALTEVDQDRRVIRRPMRFGDLVRYVESSGWNEPDTRDAVLGVVLRLAAADCSFLRVTTGDDAHEIDEDSVVDIGHEALIRRWRKLSGEDDANWVREEHEDGERYRDLVRRARAGGIVAGAELKTYEAWWTGRKPTATWAKRFVAGDNDYLAEVTEALARSRKAFDDSEQARALADDAKRETERAQRRELEAEAARARASLAEQGAKAAAAKAELEAEAARARARTADAENALHRQQVRVTRIAALVGLALLAVAAVFGFNTYRSWSDYAENQRSIAESILDQVNVANRVRLPLRDRLLMLVDASMKSEAPNITIALGKRKDQANKVLAALLLRSPVFGGSGPAALSSDSDGNSLTYLPYSIGATTGKLIRVNLPKSISNTPDLDLVGLVASSKSPEDLPLNKLAGAETQGAPVPPPTIGFVAPLRNKTAAPVLVVSPGRLSTLAGTISGEAMIGDPGFSCEDSWDDQNFAQPRRPSGGDQNDVLVIASRDAETEEIRLGNFGRGLFPPQVEYGNNSFRITSMSFGKGGLPITLCVLPLQATQADKGGNESQSADIAFQHADGFPVQIDWNPIDRQARRIPVLASDCDEFAVLGFPPPKLETKNGGEFARPILYVGDFSPWHGGDFSGAVIAAKFKKIEVDLSPGSQQLSAVAISRGCSYAIVRVSPAPNSPDKGDSIFLIQLQRGEIGGVSQYDIPIPFKGVLVPPWLYQPALAGTPLPHSTTVRVAWLSDKGVAVLDLQKEGSKVTPLPGPQAQVLFPGFLSPQSIPRLIISPDGNFVLLSSQKDFGAIPDIRVFDLRPERRALLNTLIDDGEQLREVACRVVSFLPDSSSEEEMTAPPQEAVAKHANSVCNGHAS
jgi:hypothetical protein